jgi:hypothetical protein
MRELIRADQKEAAELRLEAEVMKGLRSGKSTGLTAANWKRLRRDLQRRHGHRN